MTQHITTPAALRVVRYVIVGGTNTLIAYLIYAAGLFFSLSVPLASLISLVLSIFISFLTHGAFVFGHLSSKALLKFLANWSVMYGVYVGIVLGLMEIGINAYVGGICATAVTASLSYVVMNRFVFSGRR